jgi:hypothetical protein
MMVVNMDAITTMIIGFCDADTKITMHENDMRLTRETMTGGSANGKTWEAS